jgi:hypothetical protein
MTTLELRIMASLDIIKNKLDLCYEQIENYNREIIQLKIMGNEITVLLDYMELQEKLHR